MYETDVASIIAVRYKRRASSIIYEGVRDFWAYRQVDFMSCMRARSDPGIVSAYLYIYGRTGEGYGFANILIPLRLLFPGLRTPIKRCQSAVIIKLRGLM